MQTSELHSPNINTPDFSSPPVTETALGIQFGELQGFKSIHAGLFYQRISDRYPVVEEQPRLPRIIEHFPIRPVIRQLKFEAGIQTPRVLFKNGEDASELIQIQADRFGFNWRRPEGDTRPYPRYADYSTKLLREFQGFIDFCSDQELGVPQPNICEVVYVNEIWPKEGESAIGLFEQLFRGPTRDELGFLGTPEAVTLNRLFRVDGDRGRLYAEASIAKHPLRGDFVLFKLTGRVLHGESANVQETLRLAHDWVVNGFVELTEPGIREQRWGQTR